ncbi:hypothetical protein QTP81_02325 [Alteromonas sp. ASW11-36]|uniref:Lipoprotein n=1 Tax=Alteromonas arenosi TaxID=3055817 RepID=A0ABT7SV65_9ALTE|nr:hypothetical protein [Alteromonas sp. ASW11-36]MDM7859439.1 hypothetical protein [Alteromonas sp. ASW11-36]
MRLCIFVTLVGLLTACSKPFHHPEKLWFNSLQQGTALILSEHVDGDWNSVCIFAPYSDNAQARQKLGFEWPLEDLTTVWVLDNVSLLVFVDNNTVIDFLEVRRDHVDFAPLAGECLVREKSKFYYDNGIAVQTNRNHNRL